MVETFMLHMLKTPSSSSLFSFFWQSPQSRTEVFIEIRTVLQEKNKENHEKKIVWVKQWDVCLSKRDMSCILWKTWQGTHFQNLAVFGEKQKSKQPIPSGYTVLIQRSGLQGAVWSSWWWKHTGSRLLGAESEVIFIEERKTTNGIAWGKWVKFQGQTE